MTLGIRLDMKAVSHTDQSEARCECGQLMAKLKADGLELKCKRCKRIVLVPFGAIEGWSESVAAFKEGG